MVLTHDHATINTMPALPACHAFPAMLRATGLSSRTIGHCAAHAIPGYTGQPRQANLRLILMGPSLVKIGPNRCSNFLWNSIKWGIWPNSGSKIHIKWGIWSNYWSKNHIKWCIWSNYWSTIHIKLAIWFNYWSKIHIKCGIWSNYWWKIHIKWCTWSNYWSKIHIKRGIGQLIDQKFTSKVTDRTRIGTRMEHGWNTDPKKEMHSFTKEGPMRISLTNRSLSVSQRCEAACQYRPDDLRNAGILPLALHDMRCKGLSPRWKIAFGSSQAGVINCSSQRVSYKPKCSRSLLDNR